MEKGYTERDYGKEIDNINIQLAEIKQLLTANPPANKTPQRNIDPPMWSKDVDQRLVELHNDLCDKMEQSGNTGSVIYLGVYSSSDNQSNWIGHASIDKLLKLVENDVAAKVLSSIGNNDRLNLLIALLRKPRTVAQLVDECGYNTTGQVYHHLKPLLAADLIKEDDQHRGSYVIKGHRVQGIIMLLTGISDMLDTQYSQGEWEQAE